MPFHYGKVGSDTSDDAFEQQQTHRDTSHSSIRSKAYRAGRWTRWPATFLLLFTILGCEVSLMYSRPSSQQIGGEINRLVPGFSTEQRKFLVDYRYASDHRTVESMNATQKHWKDLMPIGGGFIKVSNNEAYTLPPPIRFPELPASDVYGIAVFHQLHCLYHMAGFIDKLTMKVRGYDLTPLDESKMVHNDHCFNYLKNALTCCGDTTLEGQSQSDKFDGPGTDGIGAVHVCRKYDDIVSWAEKRRVMKGKE